MQEVCMKFRCVWSIVLILGLAAAGTQAEAAGDRAVIAHSAYDLEEKGNQHSFTLHGRRDGKAGDYVFL